MLILVGLFTLIHWFPYRCLFQCWFSIHYRRSVNAPQARRLLGCGIYSWTLMTSRCQRWYINQAGWWNPLNYKFGKRNSQYVKPKSYPNQSHFLLMSLVLSEVGRSASQNNSNPGYSDSNGPPTPPPTYSYIERQTSYVSDISQRSSQSKYTFDAWFCVGNTFSVIFFFLC